MYQFTEEMTRAYLPGRLPEARPLRPGQHLLRARRQRRRAERAALPERLVHPRSL